MRDKGQDSGGRAFSGEREMETRGRVSGDSGCSAGKDSRWMPCKGAVEGVTRAVR